MSLTILAGISLGVFTLLHFFVVPNLATKTSRDRSPNRIEKLALMAFYSVTKSIALIFFISTILIILLLTASSYFGGTSAHELQSSIQTIRGWRNSLNGFSAGIAFFTLTALIVAMLIYAYRKSKIKAKAIFEQIFYQKYAELEMAFDNGELPEMEPNAKMMHEIEKLSELYYILENPEKIELPDNVDAKDFLHQIHREVGITEAKFKHMDISRRIEVSKLEDNEADLPVPLTFFDKIQTFFISKGFVRSLSRTNKIAYSLGLLLLIPSLLGVYSKNIQHGLSNDIVRLENLQIGLEVQKTNEEFDKLIPRTKTDERELSKEEEDVIDQIVDVYENNLVENFLRASNITRDVRFAYRSHVLKNELLGRFTSNTSTVIQYDSGSKATGITKKEKVILKASEDIASGKKSSRVKGYNLREDLKTVAKRKPKSFTDVLSKSLKSFQVPSSGKDLSRALAKQLLSSAITGVDDGEIGKYVSEVIDESMQKRFADLHDIQSKKFGTKIIKGESVKEAVNSIKSTAQYAKSEALIHDVIDNVPLDKINNKMADYPASVKAKPVKGVNTKIASESLKKLASKFGNSLEFADALGNFNDYFEAQKGGKVQTPRYKLQNKIAPARVKAVTNASRSFGRSRSFVRLRGFARVGGVLIGQEEPLPGGTVKYIDFTWKIENNELRITLIDEQNNHYTSEAYNMSIAYYAMNYVADGRPLAVTMVKAEPMLNLKILLHPTLVDTPMGHRLIELDRFVGEYARKENPLLLEAENMANGAHALYSITWALRLKMVLDQYTPTSKERPQYNNNLEFAEDILNNSRTQEYAIFALENKKALLPSYSPLYKKVRFYENSLVRKINKTALETDNLLTFAKKVQGLFNLESADMASLPEFEVWSGVRERKFTLDPDQLLMRTADNPLDFILQTAFVTSPINYEGDTENFEDLNPWEFPELRDHIRRRVLKGYKNELRSRTVMEDAIEFTYLQRFYRMAINGHLGNDFPIEKLLDLAEDLEENIQIKYTLTPRWNYNYDEQAFIRYWRSSMKEEDVQELLKLRKNLGIEKEAAEMRKTTYKGLPSF